jgi:hypothetical protein
LGKILSTCRKLPRGRFGLETRAPEVEVESSSAID